MLAPKWNILVATLGQREERFTRLVSSLLPQLEKAEGQVRLTALWNNGERAISHVRQDLVDHAVGEYITFVDDDDELPEYYVEKILPLLDGIDYIGWRMQCILDGNILNPTFHSLKYNGWYDDENGYYRDISHLNPIRLDLARHADFRKCTLPEDIAWVTQLRPHIKTEHYIDDVMYTYHASSIDTTWRNGHNIRAARRTRRQRYERQIHQRHTAYVRPVIDSPFFSYHPWEAS